LNWIDPDTNSSWYDNGWYMVVAFFGASFGGSLTLVAGHIGRKRVGELEKTLLGEVDNG